ncbi:hypothetical protein JL721_8292 [Aureococcus anophagefferens]|nr:hypothetical protein JL721_8292 [Aureococcus anophagefferens]
MAESAELLNPLLSESGDLRDSLPRGLSSVEAAAKLARFGRNEVPVETPSRLSVFLRQFSGTMPAMLMLACVLSAAVKDWEDFGIIAAMLLLNATIGFYEESKAMAALDALQAKLRASARRVITETGLDTEIGKAMGLVAEAQAGPKAMGLFESKILAIIKLLICVTLGVTAVVFAVQLAVREEPFDRVLLVSLSLVIGAVPIALPLVMQVTMALGARSMAEHAAIITHTTALQEIASMTVLNSDKTGTLTTAKMSVIPSMVWDPVDCAILAAFKARFAAQGEADPKHAEHASGSLRRASTWGRRSSFAGFNPDVKRAVATFEGCEAALGLATAKIAKGLLDKVLDTGGDGGEHQWVVEGLKNSDDDETATAAAAAWDAFDADDADGAEGCEGAARARPPRARRRRRWPPRTRSSPPRATRPSPSPATPRADTQATLDALNAAGVEVKMITGDHLNIAKETARLVGLGDNILPQAALWPASATRDETIRAANGFAAVMPVDKREVVLVLQRAFDLVVGMTGDGVNDAAALAQAQVGIAVEGVTDAAKNAADIVLTAPGLSAIYAAVYESRLIFRRVRSYVLYRVAATVQIIAVLRVDLRAAKGLIFGWNAELDPLYVVLLALFNDATITPIAHDNATPSPTPETPTVFTTKPPSLALFASVMGGNAITTLMCAYGVIVAATLDGRALLGIWAYDLAAFLALDLLKVAGLWAVDGLERAAFELPPPDSIQKTLAGRRGAPRRPRLRGLPASAGLAQVHARPPLRGACRAIVLTAGARPGRRPAAPAPGARPALSARRSSLDARERRAPRRA